MGEIKIMNRVQLDQAQPDIQIRMTKLKNMFKAGIISQDEFECQRRNILKQTGNGLGRSLSL